MSKFYRWDIQIRHKLGQKILIIHTMSQDFFLFFGINVDIMSADGKDGMDEGNCPKRAESSALSDRSKSLVLVNHFRTIPIKQATCKDNSEDLINMLSTCYGEAGNRWANFVAVDYYKVRKLCSG